MSEWKVCEDCGHWYTQHGVWSGDTNPWINGTCTMTDCTCSRFSTDYANFF